MPACLPAKRQHHVVRRALTHCCVFSQVQLRARNVLLATGGYASDFTKGSSILQVYRPDLIELPTASGPSATGDGIKLAAPIGAKLLDMENVQVHPTGFVDPRKPHEKVKTLCAELLRGIGGIMLDTRGHRFVNELGTRDYISGRCVVLRRLWFPRDDAVRRLARRLQRRECMVASLVVVRRMLAQGANQTFSLVLNEGAAAAADKHVPLYLGKGLLRRHDTLTSLSRELGVDLSVLQKTFADYSAGAAAGCVLLLMCAARGGL